MYCTRADNGIDHFYFISSSIFRSHLMFATMPFSDYCKMGQVQVVGQPWNNVANNAEFERAQGYLFLLNTILPHIRRRWAKRNDKVQVEQDQYVIPYRNM